jgi:hypothetical protein
MFFLQNMKNYGTQFDTKQCKVLKGQIEKGVEQILDEGKGGGGGGGWGFCLNP